MRDHAMLCICSTSFGQHHRLSQTFGCYSGGDFTKLTVCREPELAKVERQKGRLNKFTVCRTDLGGKNERQKGTLESYPFVASYLG